MEEKFRIIPFEEKYYSQLKELIREGWNDNHIFLKSDELVRWEYTGYGKKAGMKFPLLFDGEKLIGFRMMTPIELSVSNKEGNHTILPSAVSTVWFLKKEYRGQKLGLKMQLHTIDYYGGYFAIASNLKTSAPIHRKSGAKMLNTMYRYFRPLANDISQLLVGDICVDWTFREPQLVVLPKEINTAELEKVWCYSIEGKNITALNRSVDFWQWRYYDSPIYKYNFFQSEAGIVVGRVSALYDDNCKRNHQKVYRILELIPKDNTVWEGNACKPLSYLIDGVCGWAKQQGCIAVEFYMSTSRFERVMEDCGFDEINRDETKANSVMSYFEPCTSSHRLSNVTVLSKYLPDDFDFENSYFTLSDADQDRPNII